MEDKKEIIYEGKHGNNRIASASGFFFTDFGGGLQVNWSAENFGFGGFTVGFDKERGTMQVDSEMMSREFVAKVMEKLIQDSLFTDFESAEKKVAVATLEDIDKVFPTKKNVIYLPFYEQESKDNSELYEMRWHLPEEKVLNVWFDKKFIVENPECVFSFSHPFSQDKLFTTGFVKAEIWSWSVTKK